MGLMILLMGNLILLPFTGTMVIRCNIERFHRARLDHNHLICLLFLAHFAGVVSTRLVIVSILMELSQFQIHNCWGIIKWVIILPTPILDGIVNKVSKGMKGTIMELPIISGNPQVTLKTPTSHP